jgi:hypothetical protein
MLNNNTLIRDARAAVLAEELMRLNLFILSDMAIRSGKQLEDELTWNQYVRRVNNMVATVQNTRMDYAVADELEDNNHHMLLKAMLELNRFFPQTFASADSVDRAELALGVQ